MHLDGPISYTIPLCSFILAQWAALNPFASRKLISAPYLSNSFTIYIYPNRAA